MPQVVKLLVELSHRKVIRTLAAYVVAIWALAEGMAGLFPVLGLPDWLVRAFVYAGILGIPIVIFLAWRFDLTLHGVVRDPPRKASDVPASRTQDAPRWLSEGAEGVITASWTGPDGQTQRKRFMTPFVIGRDVTSDIQLLDQRVSRRHTVICAEDGRWIVRDLDSSNGTFLDDERIQAAPLPMRCKLQLHRQGPTIDLVIETAEETVLTNDGRPSSGSTE